MGDTDCPDLCVCLCNWTIFTIARVPVLVWQYNHIRFYICCNGHVTSTGAPQLALRRHLNHLLYLLTCYCSLLLGVGPHPSWVGLPTPAGPSSQCCSGVHMVNRSLARWHTNQMLPRSSDQCPEITLSVVEEPGRVCLAHGTPWTRLIQLTLNCLAATCVRNHTDDYISWNNWSAAPCQYPGYCVRQP